MLRLVPQVVGKVYHAQNLRIRLQQQELKKGH